MEVLTQYSRSSSCLRILLLVSITLASVGVSYSNVTSIVATSASDATNYPHAMTATVYTTSMTTTSEEYQTLPRDIYLLGLFPMSGSWAGGQGQRKAIILGLEHVNDRRDILPSYRLTLRPHSANQADTQVSICTD